MAVRGKIYGPLPYDMIFTDVLSAALDLIKCSRTVSQRSPDGSPGRGDFARAATSLRRAMSEAVESMLHAKVSFGSDVKMLFVWPVLHTFKQSKADLHDTEMSKKVVCLEHLTRMFSVCFSSLVYGNAIHSFFDNRVNDQVLDILTVEAVYCATFDLNNITTVLELFFFHVEHILMTLSDCTPNTLNHRSNVLEKCPVCAYGCIT